MAANRDSQIDAYISNAPDFARPILLHLRKLIHDGCPDVEETMKWSRPHFLHKGLLCGMSAFQHHCAFGFWLGELVFSEMPDASAKGNAMGQFGRLTSVSDLPGDKKLLELIRKAARN